MHEAKFTAEIVSAVVEKLKGNPGRTFQRVKVRVGAMLHLEPESVQLHYALQTKGTALEGVELVLTEVPVLLFCRACQKQGGVDDHHLLFCSFCGSREVEVKAGDAVVIEEMGEK